MHKLQILSILSHHPHFNKQRRPSFMSRLWSELKFWIAIKENCRNSKQQLHWFLPIYSWYRRMVSNEGVENKKERNQENVKIMSSGVAVSAFIGAVPLSVVEIWPDILSIHFKSGKQQVLNFLQIKQFLKSGWFNFFLCKYQIHECKKNPRPV